MTEQNNREEFAEEIRKEIDPKFWKTIEYENNLYNINKVLNDKDKQWPSKQTS